MHTAMRTSCGVTIHMGAPPASYPLFD